MQFGCKYSVHKALARGGEHFHDLTVKQEQEYEMAIFSRKSNESVVIGDGLERLLKLTVLCINDGSVKFSIEVAEGIRVCCGEIFERRGPSAQLRADYINAASAGGLKFRYVSSGGVIDRRNPVGSETPRFFSGIRAN